MIQQDVRTLEQDTNVISKKTKRHPRTGAVFSGGQIVRLQIEK